MLDAIWHPKRVTHGKSYVVHLNVWLTISHMIDDAMKGNKGIKKKEKENNNKNNKNKINKKKDKNESQKAGGHFLFGERESVGEREYYFYFFSSLCFFFRSMQMRP